MSSSENLNDEITKFIQTKNISLPNIISVKLSLIQTDGYNILSSDEKKTLLLETLKNFTFENLSYDQEKEQYQLFVNLSDGL
jgi:hypothetical protein